MYERFTDGARRALTNAKQAAWERGSDLIRPSHLALGLARSHSVASRALNAAGATEQAIEDQLEPIVSRRSETAEAPIPFDQECKELIEAAVQLATRETGAEPISTRHLLAALVGPSEASPGMHLLSAAGADCARLRQGI